MQTKLLLTVTALSLSYPTALKAEFTPIAGWDKQLFPSYIIGTAAMKTEGVEPTANELGEINGLIGVEIVAPHDDVQVQVTIECSGYSQPSQFVGSLEKESETYRIFPKMKYRFDRLSQCLQATPASVTFRVQFDDNEAEEKSTTVTFRSINDCPLGVVLGESFVDTSFTFASYVNEQHPFIDKMLREALDIGIVDSFSGYQAGSSEQVLLQVYAIWDLLVARDVRYSSITKTAADSEIILSQNVRLLEDTINNQQANCVDGSILLVSMLRKIEIEAQLVLVPGHCYICFFLDKDRTSLVALETTLMGTEVDWPDDVDELLETAVDESLRDEYSWPSFVQAINIGMGNLESSEKEFDDPSTGYRFIDIGQARMMGVLPIPHRGKEQFVSFDHSSYETDDQSTELNEEFEEDQEEEDE